jgi:hypothetical protein
MQPIGGIAHMLESTGFWANVDCELFAHLSKFYTLLKFVTFLRTDAQN